MAFLSGCVPTRTVSGLGDFLQRTRRHQDDAGGTARRVVLATSPRPWHLFLLGSRVGTHSAALESANRVLPIPAAMLIGKHATLAGVPERLWRLLAVLLSANQQQALAVYRSSISR